MKNILPHSKAHCRGFAKKERKKKKKNEYKIEIQHTLRKRREEGWRQSEYNKLHSSNLRMKAKKYPGRIFYAAAAINFSSRQSGNRNKQRHIHLSQKADSNCAAKLFNSAMG